MIVDQAEQKGTGRWTAQDALELGVPLTAITEAVFARSLSSLEDERAAAVEACSPGPSPARTRGPTASSSTTSSTALYASKVVAYAQGFEQMAAASKAERLGPRPRRDGDDLARRLHHPRPLPQPDPRGLRRRARTWSTCCIVPYFRDAVADGQDAWRRVIVAAVEQGVAGPRLHLSLAYYDGYRRERGPAGADPGPARLLRRPHLPAHRRRGHLPRALAARTAPRCGPTASGG